MATSENERSSLDQLPPEVTMMIFEILEHPDMGNLRLASKMYAAVGGKVICANVHVMFTRKSFHNLLNIARHPVLSRGVVELVYDCATLIYMQPDQYMSNIVDAVKERFDSGGDQLGPNDSETVDDPDLTAEIDRDFTAGWAAYRPIMHDQWRMMKDRYDTIVLAQALFCFRNLRVIIVNNDSRIMTAATRQVYHPTKAIQCELLQKGYWSHEIRGALKNILLSLSMSMELERLEVGTLSVSFAARFPLGILPFFPVISQLRHLTLTMERRQNSSGSAGPEEQKDMADILRSAPGLEDLNLTFIDSSDVSRKTMLMEPQLQAQLNEILGRFTWQRLRRLQLTGATVKEQQFNAFLRRNSAALRIIELDSMTLDDTQDHWYKVFDALKDDLNLKQIKSNGTWGWIPDARLNEFVSFQMMPDQLAVLCDAILTKGRGSVRPIMESFKE